MPNKPRYAGLPSNSTQYHVIKHPASKTQMNFQEHNKLSNWSVQSRRTNLSNELKGYKANKETCHRIRTNSGIFLSYS